MPTDLPMSDAERQWLFLRSRELAQQGLPLTAAGEILRREREERPWLR